MKKFETYTVPESKCPTCGEVFDKATNLTNNGGPSENIFSICAYCGEILRFGKDLVSRKAQRADLEELMWADKRLYQKLLHAQFFVRIQRRRQK